MTPPQIKEQIQAILDAKLSRYEMQVLIGTSISGCNMAPDRVFNLPAAWQRLHGLGLIDRIDGLAVITDLGDAFVERTLALRGLEATANEPGEAVADWFAVQSVTGTHIGMWNDERIARRVFEQEYPDGKFIRLYAHSAPQDGVPAPVVSDEMVERAAQELMAHGEFSSIPWRNHDNALVAARAALTAALEGQS